MLEHTAKDGPDDASLKHVQSICILRSNSPRLVSIEEHRMNQCAIYLRFRAGSKSFGCQQSVKPIVCTILLHNASPDFAADVVVRSNDRPKIAELFYHFQGSRHQLIHYVPVGPYHGLSLRQADTLSLILKSNSSYFAFESGVRLTNSRCRRITPSRAMKSRQESPPPVPQTPVRFERFRRLVRYSHLALYPGHGSVGHEYFVEIHSYEFSVMSDSNLESHLQRFMNL